MEPRRRAGLGADQLPRHDGLRRLVQHLNYVYKNEPALWNQDDTHEGFEWIDFHDADNSVVSFFRRSREGDIVVFVVNATPLVRLQLSSRCAARPGSIARSSIPMPRPTAAATSAISAECRASRNHGWRREHSVLIHLPPLATIAFKLEP